MLSGYTVVSNSKLTPTIVRLVLKKNPNEKILSFQPGQYATISFYSYGRPTAERCFSLAGSPVEQDFIEFGIRVGGKFTQAVEKLEPGDTVRVRGPYGNFVFDHTEQKEIVLCAGGIGITPFLSMIRFATKTRVDTKITLIVGARSQDEIPYHDELVALSNENPLLRIVIVVANGEIDKISTNFKILTGYVNQDVMIALPEDTIKNADFFLCGPPPFMSSLITALKNLRIPEEKIITEAFSQGNSKEHGHGWPLDVYTLGAIGTVFASMLVLVGDMLRVIPQTVLPEKLSAEGNTLSNRQNDLDTMVNSLSRKLATIEASPKVISAEKEVADAEAKIAALAGKKVTVTSPKPTQTTSNTISKPAVQTPACKTGASGC